MKQYGFTIYFGIWTVGCLVSAMFFPPERGLLIGFGVLSFAMCIVTLIKASSDRNKEV